MKPWVKGLVIVAVHVALVASLGAKLLYDRATRPRAWALTAPYDPNLPIRGRYVSLQIVVEPKGILQTKPGKFSRSDAPVILHAEADHLVAEAKTSAPGEDSSELYVQFMKRGDRELAVLYKPVAFFIPEHVPDPSRRSQGEELWVEVTIPKKGPPRPIRLGVKTGDGPIVPLELR